MPVKSRSVCVKAIIAAGKSGQVTQAQARQILSDIEHRAAASARARNISLQNALRNIPGEMQASYRTIRAIDVRNRLLTYRAFSTMMEIAHSGNDKNWADKVYKHLENAYWSGAMRGKEFISRFQTHLQAHGAWDDFRNGLHGRDVFAELWNLSSGLGRATGNDVAYRIAHGFHAVNDQIITLKNTNGAMINRAPGYTIPQTHDIDKVRLGGGSGIAGYGKLTKEMSFQAWSRFIKDLNIDWNRTLAGGTAADQDEFLKQFHEAIYTRVYHDEIESIADVAAYSAHGSLANKLSTARQFWFGDADSAWKYQEMFGSKEYHTAMLSNLLWSGRKVSLLQHFGPNPENTIKKTLSQLEVEARALPGTESQKELKHLGWRGRFEDSWFVLSGNSEVTTNVTASRFVDNVKALALIAKSGAILLSSLTDRAMLSSQMVLRGVGMLDRARLKLLSWKPLTTERRQVLEGMNWVADSLIANNAERWVGSSAPNRALRKGVDWEFSLNGMNRWTDVNERTGAEVAAWILGRDAEKPFAQLDADSRGWLADHDIRADEWDLIRNHRYHVPDYGVGGHVLTIDKVDSISQQEWAGFLSGRGLAVTNAMIGRAAQDLRAKLGSYVADFVYSASPRPGLRVKAFLAINRPRGDVLREMMNLFSVYKSFPMTVALSGWRGLQKGFKSAPGVMEWLSSNKKGFVYLGIMLGQTAFLGMVSNAIRDLLAGKEPKPLFHKDGEPVYKTWVAAMARGGGAGILGDILFSEYDHNTRSILEAVAGPVLGQAIPISRLITGLEKQAVGEGPGGEKLAYQAFRLAESNAPFLNLFYVKPILDHFMGYALKEALSPGILRRMEQASERENLQGYWISPAQVADMGPFDIGGKISLGYQGLEDLMEKNLNLIAE